MTDRDLRSNLPDRRREGADVLGNGVVEGDGPCFDQGHHAPGGHRLGDRLGAADGLHGHGAANLDVGEPECVGPHHPAGDDEGQGDPGNVVPLHQLDGSGLEIGKELVPRIGRERLKRDDGQRQDDQPGRGLQPRGCARAGHGCLRPRPAGRWRPCPGPSRPGRRRGAAPHRPPGSAPHGLRRWPLRPR